MDKHMILGTVCAETQRSTEFGLNSDTLAAGADDAVEPQRRVDGDGRPLGLHQVLAEQHEQRQDVPGRSEALGVWFGAVGWVKGPKRLGLCRGQNLGLDGNKTTWFSGSGSRS